MHDARQGACCGASPPPLAPISLLGQGWAGQTSLSHSLLGVGCPDISRRHLY